MNRLYSHNRNLHLLVKPAKSTAIEVFIIEKKTILSSVFVKNSPVKAHTISFGCISSVYSFIILFYIIFKNTQDISFEDL